MTRGGIDNILIGCIDDARCEKLNTVPARAQISISYTRQGDVNGLALVPARAQISISYTKNSDLSNSLKVPAKAKFLIR